MIHNSRAGHPTAALLIALMPKKLALRALPRGRRCPGLVQVITVPGVWAELQWSPVRSLGFELGFGCGVGAGEGAGFGLGVGAGEGVGVVG
jgi:hypothetical protein